MDELIVPSRYKVCLKIADRLLQCVVMNRLFLTFAESHSVFVFFKLFSYLLENSFNTLLTENLLQKIYLQTHCG